MCPQGDRKTGSVLPERQDFVLFCHQSWEEHPHFFDPFTPSLSISVTATFIAKKNNQQVLLLASIGVSVSITSPVSSIGLQPCPHSVGVALTPGVNGPKTTVTVCICREVLWGDGSIFYPLKACVSEEEICQNYDKVFRLIKCPKRHYQCFIKRHRKTDQPPCSWDAERGSWAGAREEGRQSVITDQIPAGLSFLPQHSAVHRQTGHPPPDMHTVNTVHTVLWRGADPGSWSKHPELSQPLWDPPPSTLGVLSLKEIVSFRLSVHSPNSFCFQSRLLISGKVSFQTPVQVGPSQSEQATPNKYYSFRWILN